MDKQDAPDEQSPIARIVAGLEEVKLTPAQRDAAVACLERNGIHSCARSASAPRPSLTAGHSGGLEDLSERASDGRGATRAAPQRPECVPPASAAQ